MRELSNEDITKLTAAGWTFKQPDPAKPGIWSHPTRGLTLKATLNGTTVEPTIKAPDHVNGVPPIGPETFAEVRKEGELPPNPTGADIHAAEVEARKDVQRRDHEHRPIKD